LSKLRKQLLKALGDDTVEYVDVGARWGLAPHWEWLTSNLHWTMFEPDPAEAADLRAQVTSRNLNCSVIQAAIWNGPGKQSFNLTRMGGNSSILEPNREFIDQYPEGERFDIMEKIETDTDNLDNVLDAETGVDFLKIDVQGGSLMVLEGAKGCLEGVLGLEVEAEFVELYRGEPQFGAIHQFLIERQFELVDVRANYWLRTEARDVPGCRGQAVTSDSLYMISPRGLANRMKGLNKSQVLQSLVRLLVCCSVYGLEDWMVSYISACRKRELIGDNALIDDIERRCKKGGILGWLPAIPGRMGICMVLMDIAYHVNRSRKSWVYQDNTLGNMPRTRWTRWMRP
jgi:FkbM family methyltransferase